MTKKKTTVTIEAKPKAKAAGVGGILSRFKTLDYAYEVGAQVFKADHVGMSDREPFFGMVMEMCKNTTVRQNMYVEEMEAEHLIKEGYAKILRSRGVYMPDMVVTNAKGINTILSFDCTEFHFDSGVHLNKTINYINNLLEAKNPDGGKVVSVIMGYQKYKWDKAVQKNVKKFKEVFANNPEVIVLDFTHFENALLNPTVMISKPSVAGVAEEIMVAADCVDQVMEACGMADEYGFSVTSFNKVLDVLQYRLAASLGITLPELREIAATMKNEKVTTVVGLQQHFGFKYKGQFALFCLGRNCKNLLDDVPKNKASKNSFTHKKGGRKTCSCSSESTWYVCDSQSSKDC